MNVKELKPARLTYSSPGHRPGLCRNVLIEPYRGDIEWGCVVFLIAP
jgi:hypothetical protein